MQGIPYVVAMTVAVIMFKRLGISNADIALYTSWLYLPWVIKPLWDPIVDLLKTKRWWIVVMQLVIGAGLGGVALAIPLPGFFKITLIFLWLLAFSSATHDIAADGFYMLGLQEHQQAYFVGIRSTFYRIAMITGQGLLIILAGFFETSTGLKPIEITVDANPAYSQSVVIPENRLSNDESDGKSYFMTLPQQVQVSTENIAVERLDSIRRFISNHNQTNGFVHHSNAGQSSKQNKRERFVMVKLRFGTADSFSKKAFSKREVGCRCQKLDRKCDCGRHQIKFSAPERERDGAQYEVQQWR